MFQFNPRDHKIGERSVGAAALAVVLGLPFIAPARAEIIPVGTEVTIRLEQDIRPGEKNSKNTKDSGKFSAPLAYPIFADGREVLPAGSKLEGEIRGSKKIIFLSPRYVVLPDGRKLEFSGTVSGVNKTGLKADNKEGTIESKGGSKADAAHQAGEIGSEGAVIGALSTYTLEGMAIGAAAGVAGVLIGRKIAGMGKETVIPAGTQLTFDLNQALEVPNDMIDAKSVDDQIGDRTDRRPVLRRDDSPSTITP